MSVINTDKWLLKLYDRPIEMCKKLEACFEGAAAAEIYEYLNMNGMYDPSGDGKKVIKTLQKNRVWEVVQSEEQKLQKEWDGPNIPIFIFPSDSANPDFYREFNGKSGLAFQDKLFLFIAGHNSEREIKSLFTHEYNHVCRLSKFPKHEDDYVLLDTIILEGIAENAVRERLGEEFISKWTKNYSDEELDTLWRTIVQPNQNMLKSHYKHHELLYGLGHYPKMLGYCVGYYLVKQFLKDKKLTSKDLLHMEASHIAQF